MPYPPFFRVRQRFDTPRVEDPTDRVRAELAQLDLASKVRPGQTVAVTVGSRGIANLVEILRAIVGFFRELQADPFLAPAMGSHGGATAQGQRDVLRDYGVTEASVGCPVRSSMETVVVCQAAEGFPVHLDRLAYEADHVVVCNRVKPHTRFTGDIQSGLMKMMLIGLGNHAGAQVYHRAVEQHGFPRILRSAAGEVLARCSILAGVAIVENALDQTAHIEAVRPADFETREVELLKLARRWMPRLPFTGIDLLLVDQIGKNFAGVGMDTVVLGCKADDPGPEDGDGSSPEIRLIAIRGLSPETHGNAHGLGMAHLCKSRLLREMDREATRLNALTAKNPAASRIPLDFETDREILDVALDNIGLREPAQARILWIPNTLELSEVECSAAYLEEAQKRSDLTILTDLRPLPLDQQGNLPSMRAVAPSRTNDSEPLR